MYLQAMDDGISRMYFVFCLNFWFLFLFIFSGFFSFMCNCVLFCLLFLFQFVEDNYDHEKNMYIVL